MPTKGKTWGEGINQELEMNTHISFKMMEIVIL